jgi:hypothetical protein
VADGQLLAGGEGEQRVDDVTGVDDHRLTRRVAGDDEAVLVEGAGNLRFN